ncbi:hypothetical protein ACIA8E_36865 [Streptomyces sp. NPDC051664]
MHDHLVLSVKVRRTGGQWGTLHTRTPRAHCRPSCTTSVSSKGSAPT